MYREPQIVEHWLVLADMHLGSEVAPMPDNVEVSLANGDARVIRPTATQRKLNQVWKEMCDNLPPLKGIIVNGDCCDGMNRKSHGRGCWTTDLKLQAESCAYMLRPVLEHLTVKENLYFTMGSAYHIEEDRPLDETVCRLVGGKYKPEHLIETFNGDVRFHAQHVIRGGMNFMYAATAPSREQLFMELQNAERGEYGPVNWCVRSHRHYYTLASRSPRKGCFVSPGWKAKDEFGVKIGSTTIPDIGWVIMKIDEDGDVWIKPNKRKAVKPTTVEVAK